MNSPNEFPDDIQSLIAKAGTASRVADATPEPYRLKAFEIAYTSLLAGGWPTNARQASGTSEPRTKKSGSPKVPKTDPKALTRLDAINDVLEDVASFQAELLGLKANHQICGILLFAREKLRLESLATAEVRELANGRFKLGMPDGTIRGALSTLQPQYVQMRKTDHGTEWMLMARGETLFREARRKDSDDEGTATA